MNNTLEFCIFCEIRNVIDIDSYTKRCLSCGAEWKLCLETTVEDEYGNVKSSERRFFKKK